MKQEQSIPFHEAVALELRKYISSHREEFSMYSSVFYC